MKAEAVTCAHIQYVTHFILETQDYKETQITCVVLSVCSPFVKKKKPFHTPSLHTNGPLKAETPKTTVTVAVGPSLALMSRLMFSTYTTQPNKPPPRDMQYDKCVTVN